MKAESNSIVAAVTVDIERMSEDLKASVSNLSTEEFLNIFIEGKDYLAETFMQQNMVLNEIYTKDVIFLGNKNSALVQKLKYYDDTDLYFIQLYLNPSPDHLTCITTSAPSETEAEQLLAMFEPL